jgi:hypothetical protein
MPQIFHPATNPFSKFTIFGAVFIVAAALWVLDRWYRSSYVTEVGVVREQPVPFSHEHHVRGLGIDCRYCHTSVEKSAFAGIPSTQICMGCHAEIWRDAPILAPLRASWRDDRPIAWTRVNDLPDYAYFDHSIHVAKGIGCSSCHGQVDQMPLMWKTETLHMEWCLRCHRQPEKHVRPLDEVFNTRWTPSPDQTVHGESLARQYGIEKDQLTNCSICHR